MEVLGLRLSAETQLTCQWSSVEFLLIEPKLSLGQLTSGKLSPRIKSSLLTSPTRLLTSFYKAKCLFSNESVQILARVKVSLQL